MPSNSANRPLIALDLDGTLEDSRTDMVAAVQRVRARRGLPDRADGDFVAHVNRGMAHLYRHCFDDALEASDSAGQASDILAVIATDYQADYLAHIADTTRLYPGMADALAALAEIGPLAVVTNKPEALSRALLEALGVLDRFTAVVGGDTCAESKPSPVPLAHAASLCGVSIESGSASGPGPAPVFMIGDSAGDIRTGRALGATVIWCAWGYYDQPGDSAPDRVAHAPTDLPALVREHLATRNADSP